MVTKKSTDFQFKSVGKQGVIQKAIALFLIENNIYNLALLDFDPVTQDYTDKSVTDNGDMPEVLATVMAVIMRYLNNYPERRIFLTGTTNSRTRLYQIAINKVLSQAETELVVFGYHHFEWIPFEPNIPFEGFLIGKNYVF